jgi:hypothetical protein
MTVYTLKKKFATFTGCHASLMSDFDDVNFSVILALYFSFWVSPEQYWDDSKAK